ncbi:MAG TPA: MinD/ParA family protein [Anaerolineales bacterium]|nr:MinD/ParA family protein [Anaerolineales bacterium]
MSKIISVHSFRGGTGKSNTTANLAALFAMEGQRVGVIDTDIQSPGIHVLFGLGEDDMGRSLNDYLWGKCDIKETAHDVTPRLGAAIKGKVFLIPSSIKAGEIARVLREGYDVGLLNDGFHRLVEDLNLDVLMIDTHPGLNEETLLSIAISDALAILLRPDQQDYQGTSVTVEVARKLDVPRLLLIVNKVPTVFDAAEVKARVEKTYNCEVAAVLPHSDELMTLASAGVFALRYPAHPVTGLYKQIAAKLMA